MPLGQNPAGPTFLFFRSAQHQSGRFLFVRNPVGTTPAHLDSFVLTTPIETELSAHHHRRENFPLFAYLQQNLLGSKQKWRGTRVHIHHEKNLYIRESYGQIFSLSKQASNPSLQPKSSPRRNSAPHAKPTAPRASPRTTAPVGAFIVTRDPLAAALTIKKLWPSGVTNASPLRHPPSLEVSYNGFLSCPRSRRSKFRLNWCTIEPTRAPSPVTHGATAALSHAHCRRQSEMPWAIRLSSNDCD
jgi:hypothetical protein